MADAKGAAEQADTATSPTMAAPTRAVRMLILSIFAAFAALARSIESPGSVIFANPVLGVQTFDWKGHVGAGACMATRGDSNYAT
jgi:hypothetical protein